MTSTDLVARLRDGIVVQQAGPSALIGTPDFTATVALMREAADRLERESGDLAYAKHALDRETARALRFGRELTASQAEVDRLTEALKQHERILLIAAVRRAAEIAAPLWLKAADDMSAALQQKEA